MPMDETNLDDVLDINMDDFGDLDDVEQSLRMLDQSSKTPSESHKENKEEPEIDLSMPKLSTESLLSMDFDEDDAESFSELKELEDSMNVSNNIESSLDTSKDTEEDEDEDIEDWDLSIVKSKLKSLAVPIIIVVVIVLFLATTLGKKTATTPTDVTVQSNPNMLNTGLFEVSEPVAVSTKGKQDYIIAYKYMFTWNDLCQPVIKGELTKPDEKSKEKHTIEIPVDVETFNSIKDGQIITVYYDELTFNNNQYITNVSLGEVVGE